jgi:GxxExxY protein
MISEITQIAEYLYENLGPGHKDKTYRDAIALELQERGYTVKTESPSPITYTTQNGKTMIVGSEKVDICAFKEGKYTFIEIRAMLSFLNKKKDPNEAIYLKIRKYLSSLGLDNGIIINFPFPPMENVEIIQNKGE